MADDFVIKSAPVPAPAPKRDACKFRHLVIKATEDGKNYYCSELFVIDYDSADPKEKVTVGKAATFTLYKNAKARMSAFEAALNKFISDWMDSRETEEPPESVIPDEPTGADDEEDK